MKICQKQKEHMIKAQQELVDLEENGPHVEYDKYGKLFTNCFDVRRDFIKDLCFTSIEMIKKDPLGDDMSWMQSFKDWWHGPQPYLIYKQTGKENIKKYLANCPFPHRTNVHGRTMNVYVKPDDFSDTPQKWLQDWIQDGKRIDKSVSDHVERIKQKKQEILMLANVFKKCIYSYVNSKNLS